MLERHRVRVETTHTIFVVDLIPARDHQERLEAIEEALKKLGVTGRLSTHVYMIRATVQEAMDRIQSHMEPYLRSHEEGVIFIGGWDSRPDATFIAPVRTDGEGPILVDRE